MRARPRGPDRRRSNPAGRRSPRGTGCIACCASSLRPRTIISARNWCASRNARRTCSRISPMARARRENSSSAPMVSARRCGRRSFPMSGLAYAGYVAWRGLVDEAALSAATHAALFDAMVFCLPPGEQFLSYPVAGPDNDLRPGHRRCNFVWYRPADEHGHCGRCSPTRAGARMRSASRRRWCGRRSSRRCARLRRRCWRRRSRNW